MLRIKYQRIPGLRKRGNPIYRSWAGMIRRCYNQRNKDYKFYGGRGIFVCERWMVFINFHEDMAETFKEGLTLERRDVNAGYMPANCCWVNHQEQCRNRRSTNWLINPSTGERKTLTDWAREFGLSRNTITSRMRLGYRDFASLVSSQHAIRNGYLTARNIRD